MGEFSRDDAEAKRVYDAIHAAIEGLEPRPKMLSVVDAMLNELAGAFVAVWKREGHDAPVTFEVAADQMVAAVAEDLREGINIKRGLGSVSLAK